MPSANLYHAQTSAQLQGAYNRLWLSMSRQYVQFYVQACSEAKIALSYFPLDASKSTFEIILGADGNTNSLINVIDMAGQSTENIKVRLSYLYIIMI